jgi:hypothetical protein
LGLPQVYIRRRIEGGLLKRQLKMMEKRRHSVSFMRCYLKVPGLGKKGNAGLTYSILAAISFKIVSLGMYTVFPSFFPCFKSKMKVIFLNAAEYRLRFPLDVDTVSKFHPFSFILNLGNKVKSQGARSSN